MRRGKDAVAVVAGEAVSVADVVLSAMAIFGEGAEEVEVDRPHAVNEPREITSFVFKVAGGGEGNREEEDAGGEGGDSREFRVGGVCGVD